MLKRSSLFCICLLFLSIVLSGEAEKPDMSRIPLIQLIMRSIYKCI